MYIYLDGAAGARLEHDGWAPVLHQHVEPLLPPHVPAPRPLHLMGERIFIELMTSDRKLKASSEGSQ